jgi:lysophospholipase L1-like esterase
LGALAVAGVWLPSAPAAAPVQQRNCDVSEKFYAFEPALPNTIRALAGGREVVIVAIGGASTRGGAVGDPALAWPARMAAALARRLPGARVKVVNLGVARQTSVEMVTRFEREVPALKPALVIWETGTMEAVRSADPDEFRQTVQAGLDRLRAAGPEVVLMDMQFSRLTHAVIHIDRYVDVLREVADANDVPLFPRHSIMRHWAESGILDLRTADREKRRQLAVRLHECIGRELADFVARGIPATRPAPAAGPESGR